MHSRFLWMTRTPCPFSRPARCPPEKQKSEFFMFDNYSLLTTALDSIKKTLQMNYVTEPGDPDKLDVYFNIENKSIVVEDVRIPMDKPWNSEMMKK